MTGHQADHSPLGLTSTALTALVIFALVVGKDRVGKRLANDVVIAEARVTFVDAILASAVLVGLALNLVATDLDHATSERGLIIAEVVPAFQATGREVLSGGLRLIGRSETDRPPAASRLGV